MLIQNITPKVTIGIPTFNRSLLIRQAVDSALRQTYKNIEVIISDNNSTDNTKDILKSYFDERLIIIEQSNNIGMVGNWNCCLEKATGEFFLLLSDDDILEVNAIQKLILGFENKSISLSYGPVSYMETGGVLTNRTSQNAPQMESGNDFILNILRQERAAFPSATLYRTVLAKSAGGYPDIGTATDFGLHFMLAMNGPVYFCSFPVCRYRVHIESESFSESAILSQLRLHEWFKIEHCLPKKLSIELQQYSIEMVYQLGRYHAIRGNKRASSIALSVLLKIHPSPRWKWLFSFLNLAPIRFFGKIRRKILQRKD